ISANGCAGVIRPEALIATAFGLVCRHPCGYGLQPISANGCAGVIRPEALIATAFGLVCRHPCGYGL
ncbi:hypothetical protein VS878_22370, partial [Salmonella enterica subsp. enterica serovar Paratyphi A]|nr:hypothetical protein [Salmonella enterica subsp. enterica serovar Paratyphi A]